MITKCYSFHKFKNLIKSQFFSIFLSFSFKFNFCLNFGYDRTLQAPVYVRAELLVRQPYG